MFAGVGNDAETKNLIGYPAAYPYVVGVAASDEEGTVGGFSEHGNYVDLAAPGLNVPTWCDATFRSYCRGRGTSQATAIASASAALVWSAHPDWTANQVLASLIDTAGRDWARDDPSTYLGYGLIRPPARSWKTPASPPAPPAPTRSPGRTPSASRTTPRPPLRARLVSGPGGRHRRPDLGGSVRLRRVR
ncbi:hypothetical protein GCM10020295_21940 [Streptomyces cinereospinus]